MTNRSSDKTKRSPDVSSCLQSELLDYLSTAVVYLDQKLIVRYLNSAGEMLLGFSSRRLVGHSIDDTPLGITALRSKLAEALATNSPFTERQMRLNPANDSSQGILVDCVVTPLVGDRGEPGLLLELPAQDRHQRITRDEQLLAQQHASRAVVRGLAHEIKNPLGGLRGAAQLLEHEFDSAALREYTRVIMDEADRLQNLVDVLLGPNTLPRMREINVHQVVERVRTLVEAEGHPGITLIPDYDPSLPTIIADPDQLIQALLNIVRNATQALDAQVAEGRHAEILLRTRAERQLTIGHQRHRIVVRVDVIDNGPGIPADVVEHVFYPMVTSRADGTGLGLSIAQDLVSRHGGLIECESRTGRTRFSIYLPLEPPSHECK
ncbi:MAG: nitrogen regulation protein NR(II) [Pseudomonadota bacterium]|nr:nitrogen regulation protein NR(II) [Pseudomonadota bacterium]